MQDVFENIIEKLEACKDIMLSPNNSDCFGEECKYNDCMVCVFAKAIEIVKQEAEKYNGGWIPVEEELPKDGDNRYYMCIVENHEEDPLTCCQYDEECGFGFYQDIYDEHTLGFVDCVFKTNEELGYDKVIAWQQLLPYQPKGE